MPLHHQIKIALIICLLLAIAGCTTTVKMYEGAELPPEQTATIKDSYHEYVFNSTFSTIFQVDRKDIEGGVGNIEIEVLPGQREVTCAMGSFIGIIPVSRKPRTLTFQAEAGHVYRVDGSYYLNHLWIVDETTGVEVAGDKPEIPEPIEHEPLYEGK